MHVLKNVKNTVFVEHVEHLNTQNVNHIFSAKKLFQEFFLCFLVRIYLAKNKTGEIMNNIELMKEFKSRLLNTTRRGSTFYNSFLKNSQTINLYKFEKKGLLTEFETLSQKFSKNKIEIDFRNNTEEFKSKKYIEINSYIRELKNIISKNKSLSSEKNQECMYIGKYFIHGLLGNEDKDYFRAPILLNKVSVENYGQTFVIDIQNEFVINNALFNLIANKNNLKWNFYEYNSDDFLDYETTIQTIKKLLNLAGLNLEVNGQIFLNTFNNTFSDVKGYTKKETKEKYLEQGFEKGFKVYPLDICAIGIFDLAAGNILSAYSEFENDANFLKEISNEVFDIFSADITETKDNEIKTISTLDYSQKDAVKNSLKQSTFIFGPPGTGKSQTIVNLIANIISMNKVTKKAIFITEKRVASNVVYDKLNKLNNFVLMLHNNESAKEIHEKISAFYNLVKNDIFKKKQLGIYNTFDNISKEYDTKLEEIIENLKTYKKVMGSDKGKNYLKSLKIISNKRIDNSFELNNDLYERVFKNFNLITNKEILNALKRVSKYFNVSFEKTSILVDLIFKSEKFREIIFNSKIKNKVSFKIGIFSKKKFTNFINSKEFSDSISELDNCSEIMGYMSKEELFDLIQTISLFKNENVCVEDIYSFYNNNFESENLSILEWNKTDWMKEFMKQMKLKNENDLNDIYTKRINYISNTILNGRYYDVKTESERELSSLFNLMGKRIDSVKTNVRLKTWFDNFYPLIELMYPIIFASPETISNIRIIPMEKEEFEYCIFDEASQIFIEKCLPAMFRSKKFIIAGDDQQLEPTDFFSTRNKIENEYTEGISDEQEELLEFSNNESLIDFAKGRYRRYMLNFHYRSKYEELIQFSNYKYYEGKLNVVSDPWNPYSKPIEVIDVEGQKQNDINTVEAEECIKLLRKIVKSEKEKSIGIITFNQHQQKYIEALVEKEIETNADLNENYNRKDKDKALFIKNIENVQGDERDIIIFSISFSKDLQGSFRNNFGPINQVGGEKRLNVAISRAKEKMYIIKSIQSEIMNPKKESIGAVNFKAFLKYSELLQKHEINDREIQLLLNNKNDINIKAQTSEILQFDSDFEEEVYNEISKKLESRYIIKTQVPCSGYKIDQAIYDLKDNKFVLAIECDGWAYHSSAYDRQRDIERQIFLENRGWNFIRISSIDWWNKDKVNRNKFLNEIIYRLKENEKND
ncbi:hypothetical protein CG008_02735 [Mesoplasma florum]|nr:hypothetical protein CG008_02735 [Mesoplasma florum]